ncbi:MAG TPA: T9SS type A sorting domain-containing protein [Chitinophagales bacterium]|nr:T9SS type A sorting domain-containing protein [Chitinophagales bacterium]
MKTTLRLMTLALGLFFYTNSQGLTICFTDEGGFTYEVTATYVSPKYYVISGTIDAGAPEAFIIDGYFDMHLGEFYMTWSNPSPDGCTGYVDALEFTATTGNSGYMEWNYSQICDGEIYSGPFFYPVTYATGHCGALRLASDAPENTIANVGSTPKAYNLNNLVITETRSLEELLSENQLVVNPMGDGFVFSSELMSEGNSEITIYNYAGQQVASLNSTSGTNMMIWDGKTASGEKAMSGMYIAVMRNGEETISTKLIK